MTADLTVLYYTSNREDPAFEAKIIANIQKQADGLPIVSVSQQPMTFGENICVGDVGTSSLNYARQLEIGVAAVRTPYVCMAESDFLYPPDYFTFRPDPPGALWLVTPIYLMFYPGRRRHTVFFPKRYSGGAMITGTDTLRRALARHLADVTDQWHATPEPSGYGVPYLHDCAPQAWWATKAPVITFKTTNNMHARTPYHRSGGIAELPYWGPAKRLAEEFFPCDGCTSTSTGAAISRS